MAGDHKCPVCQATFTRPQHVARHMRSHTGDRPYRCQHCGDQFARSDLLSRHVNKCHPNEKPLSSSAPQRRKGSTSATRATTSKQACDQCVQSSLPCDGANPCSKCVHRKCRCTFVKFHRQTAPLGPGHPSRPNDPNAAALAAAAAVANGALPGVNALPVLAGLPAVPPGYRLTDSFLLAPNAQAALAAGNQPNPLYANAAFNFGQALNNPTFTEDYAARYRAQDLPGQDGRYAAPYPRSEIPAATRNGVVDFAYSPENKQNGAYASRDDEPQYGSLPSSFEAQPGYGNPVYAYSLDHRRPSTADSDVTGSSSASSSSVHLPLPNTHPAYSATHARSASSSSSSSGYDNQQRNEGYPADGEGGFSSAFGLMSLDDPAVLAGLSEGVPFFDHANGEPNGPAWQDGVTPRAGVPPGMQDRENTNGHRNEKAGQQTPSTLRELKDMWRQYMRTPLTGQQLGHAPAQAVDDSNVTRSPPRARGEQRPIPRVASMPTVKTPDAGAWDTRGMPPLPGRGSMNNPDDLRSYEQAVLARRAPISLNLVPKKGRMGSLSQQGAPPPGSENNRPGSRGSYETHDENSPSPLPLLHPVTNFAPTAMASVDARPGFKRLASQTLAPEYAKRTAVAAQPAYGSHNESVYADDEEDEAAYIAESANFAERARRMSAPVHAAAA
ncbi:hypothetical protein PENSPDRAFT_202610 [Peniophora sp. CONT]|nr:hypothetical protein PENSPDRAFT_202610 [Peniophora sp. CONT]